MNSTTSMATPSSNHARTIFSTERGRWFLFLLLLCIPLISRNIDDFKFGLTTSPSSNELASDADAFNSYKLNTPLFEAVKSNNLELVRSLLDGGIDNDKKLVSPPLPLVSPPPKIAYYYNVNAEDPKGITPIIEATLLGNRELVEFLLLHGARAQPLPGFRHTPLRAACLTANTELITLLLERGADPNAQSEGGRTPLMGACFLRPQFDEMPNRGRISFDAVKLMMEDSRTDAKIRNDFGEDAMALCKERGYDKSVDFLKERLKK
ncbi:hypothetical protein ACHAXR_010552 [Thalassiosira sp. AJA248-18]